MVNRQRVKSHYKMRGMGPLLGMYSMVGQGLEEDYQVKKAELAAAKKAYDDEKDAKRKEQLRLAMESTKATMNAGKQKMDELLKNVKDAASKAASQLSSGAVMVGSKLSSGLKSMGSRLSSGITNIGLKAKDSYIKYNDKKDREKYDKLKAKYEPQQEGSGIFRSRSLKESDRDHDERLAKEEENRKRRMK